MTYGETIDYSWHGALDWSAIKAAGYRGICRYLSHSVGKALSHDEALAAQAAGLDICVVWEDGGERAGQGMQAGKQDAQAALQQALGLGMPADRPIYFAVDYDAKLDQVRPYFDGVRSVLPVTQIGVYGGIRIVSGLLDAGMARYAWQANAWSGGKWDARAHLQQYKTNQHVANINCDFNRVMHADFGQWHPPASLPTEVSTAAPTNATTTTTTTTNAPAFPGRVMCLSEPPMQGDDVRQVQARLHDRGWALSVTERFDLQTDDVVRKFQAEKQLQVDGKVGHDTWTALWTAPVT